MINGYVKLYRKSLDSSVFKTPELWQLWTWCLMTANYKKCQIGVTTGRGKTIVELLPGQFLFGRKTAAKELGQKETTIRYRMKTLERLETISVKAATHYSIVTIRNWDDYQFENKEISQPTANQLPTNCQPTATDKKVKKYKKVKNNQGGDEKFYNMRELSALAVKYLGWNGNLSPGQAEQLRPLTDIFKSEVDYGFNAAASANASNVAYVIKAAGNNNEDDEPKELDDFQKALMKSRGYL